MRSDGSRTSEAAPGEGRGVEANPQERRYGNNSKLDGSLATDHEALANLHARAAAIMSKSIFANRLCSYDVHVVEEALRSLFEREALYHERQASKLRYGGHPLEFLEAAEAAFEPRTS